MHVELSGGRSAELRDEWLRGDRRAVNKAVTFTLGADGSRTVSMATEDQAIEALLTRRIVSWTIGQPVPSELVNPSDVFDRLSDEDGEALATAVRPQYRRIMGIADEADDPKAVDSGPPTISGNVLSTTSSADPAPPVPSPPNGMSGLGLPSTFGGPPTR